MLKELKIENYLIIDNLEIEFCEGLNTITGETGAGKSIILGAINLLFGARADSSTLRFAERKCVIEAIFERFSNHKTTTLLNQADIEQEQELTVRRVISPSGKSKYFVNQEPVNQSFVKQLGAGVVDIHSQHQTLLIGSSDFQTEVLDTVAQNNTILDNYKKAYEEYRSATNQLERLKSSAASSKRDQEYIEFQYNQLLNAKLTAAEEQELQERYSILSNSQTIASSITTITEQLNDSDESIISKLNIVKHNLATISNFSTEATDYFERIESSIIELKDIYQECGAMLEGISQSDNELEEISQRLDLLASLSVKHGVKSADELIAIRDDYQSKLERIDNFDNQITEAHIAVEQSHLAALNIANKLTHNRKSKTQYLEEFVTKTLVKLGMKNSTLKVVLTTGERLTPTGVDEIEFLFSANLGKQGEAISKVASGGEMSRLMLTLKALISQHSDLQTLIFDEIDTGVSGRVADEMGEIINTMAHSRQIINITHLPQIAAKGETHFKVYKQHNDTETSTNIRQLTPQERVEEIATMLSGSSITEHALKQASVMIGKPQQ